MAEEYSVSLNVDSKEATKGLQAVEKEVNALDKEFQDLVQTMDGDASKAMSKLEDDMLALAQAGKRGSAEYQKMAEMLGRANQAANLVSKDIENLSVASNDVSAQISVFEDRLYELSLAGKQNTQEYKDLIQQVGNLKRTVAETDIAIERASTTSMDLGQQVGLLEDQLYQLAIEGKKDTEEFKKMAQEAGKLKQKIIEADMAVEEYAATNADLGQKVGILTDKMYRMASAGDMTSEEFRNTAREAAQAQAQITRVDMALEAMAMTGAMRMQTALGGVQGAFDAASGAMSLFGVESATAQKVMEKFQAVMQMTAAITTMQQALPAITAIKNNVVDGFGKMSQASKAFAVTGIGILIVGIGLLIEHWDKVKAALSRYTESQKALKATVNEYKEGASAARLETDKVASAFEQARQGTIKKEEALKIYNDTLGNTFGKAKDVNEAEAEFVRKKDAFVQAAALRAQAQALMQKAADEYAKQLSASMEDQRNFVEETGSVTGNLIAGLVDYSTAGLTNLSDKFDKTEAKIYKNAQARAEKESKKRNKIFTDAANDLIKQANKIDKQAGIKNEQQIALDEERAARAEAAAQKARERAQKAAEERKAALDEIDQQLAQFDEEQRLRLMTEQQKEEYAVTKKYEVLLAKAKKYGQDTSKLTTAQETELTQIRQKYADEQAKIAAEREAKIQAQIEANRQAQLIAQEEFDQQYRENTISAQQLEIDAVNEKYFTLIETAKQYGYDVTELEKRQKAELTAINDKYIEETNAKTQEGFEKKVALQQKYADNVQQGFNILSSLSSMFEGKTEKERKRAFKRNQALQIAQATVETYKNTVAAYGSQLVVGDPSSIARAVLAAAAAAAAGAANIASIAKQKYQEGSTNSSVSPELGTVTTPEFNVVGNANVNALAQLTGQPIQAYVVSGDVTTAQSLDRARVNNATL
jgi:hypothetical protein